MKLSTIVGTILVAALSVGSGSAQTVIKLAPMPSNWGLWSATFVSPTKGFACGDMKGLYRTDDGGSTWSKITLQGDQSVPIYNVTFIDQNIGLASGNSAQGSLDVYRTIDGGATWNRVSVFPLGGSWYHQDYVSPTTGFMGSNGAVVRSTDAGATWVVRSAYPLCPVAYGMDFIDSNVGLLSGYQVSSSTGGVFKTSDGGVTWSLKLSGSSNDVIYLSPTVLVADNGSAIFRSTDAGENWSVASGNVFTGISDMERVDANTIVGVSSAGDIWRSPDQGSTWVRMWVGEGDLPGNWSVEFRDAFNGVVAGVRNLMYETHDGGVTWTRLHRGISGGEWNGIAAFTDSRVTLVGHHGYLQTTRDSGQHWDIELLDPPVFGRDTSYSAVSTVGTNFALAVGHWGGMAKTTDGGQTWVNMAGRTSYDYYANDVKFTDTLNGWIVGFDYSFTKKYTQRTRDGGQTWEVVNGANIPGVAVEVRGQRVWIQTTGRPNWRSFDGGLTFQMFEVPYNEGSGPSVMGMSFASDNLGYVCGFDGYLAKTTDGGSNWSQVGSQIYNTTYLGVTAVAKELWVCGGQCGGGGAFVKRSLDGGSTWQTWSLQGQYTTPYRMARTATKLYVTGYNGETWRIDGLQKLPTTGHIYPH